MPAALGTDSPILVSCCTQAKAALPMLKARISGRQTRSRSAKATPKRASAPAKITEEAKNEAGVGSPKRASAPAKATEEKQDQAGIISFGVCIHVHPVKVRCHDQYCPLAELVSTCKHSQCC